MAIRKCQKWRRQAGRERGENMARMTMADWERSEADKRMDKRLGYKEGSKKDKAADKKGLAAANKKRKTVAKKKTKKKG